MKSFHSLEGFSSEPVSRAARRSIRSKSAEKSLASTRGRPQDKLGLDRGVRCLFETAPLDLAADMLCAETIQFI